MGWRICFAHEGAYAGWFAIVGVVGTSEYYNVHCGTPEPYPAPLRAAGAQRPSRSLFVTLRTAAPDLGLAPQVRRAFGGTHPHMSAAQVRTMQEVENYNFAGLRMISTLTASSAWSLCGCDR